MGLALRWPAALRPSWRSAPASSGTDPADHATERSSNEDDDGVCEARNVAVLRSFVEHGFEGWFPAADADGVEPMDAVPLPVEGVVRHHPTETLQLLEAGPDLSSSRPGAFHCLGQQEHRVVVLRGDDVRLGAVALLKRPGPGLALRAEQCRHVLGHDQNTFSRRPGFLQDRPGAEVPVCDHLWMPGQGCGLLQERGALTGLAESDDGIGRGRLHLVELGTEISVVRLPRVADHRRDAISILKDLDDQVAAGVVDSHAAAEHRELLELEGLSGVTGEQIRQERVTRRDAEGPLSAFGRSRAGPSDHVRDACLLDRRTTRQRERAEELPDDGRDLRLADEGANRLGSALRGVAAILPDKSERRALDPPLPVDVLHGHLDRLPDRQANRGTLATEGKLDADLDLVGRQGRRARDPGDEQKRTTHEGSASHHGADPPRPETIKAGAAITRPGARPR